MKMRWQTRDREEQSGAVAVLVGLMALMLMIVAALSVDLGNAWARGRVVQKQADLAATAAGSLLPMSPTKAGHHDTDIAALAATYLNNNVAQGQATTTGANLLDGNLANGEITFYKDDGAACTTDCDRLTLTPPGAYVTFGLAGTVKNGVNVVRSATVKLVSLPPPMAKVVPLWLPSGCGYGPVDGDTSGGGGPAAPVTTTTTTAATSSTTSTSTSTSTTTSTTSTATATATVIAISPTGTHSLSGTNTSVAYGQSLTIHGWQITGLGANITKASIRLISPDGTKFIEYAASTNVPKGTMSIPDFAIGTEISNTPGAWKAYAMAQPSGANKPIEYSNNSVTITVTGSAPSTSTSAPASSSTTATSATTSASATASDTSVPVGCVGSDRGNFGQMDSPRAGGGQHQTVLALNMAIGLDHRLSLYSGTLTPTQKECADKNGNNPINTTIVQLDNVSRDKNNCIIADSGNDGPAFYDGLIGGVSGNPGRLDVVNGHTKSGCGSPARADLTVNGKTINNDELSCFLNPGFKLEDIASATADPSMLDQSISKSPRLVYLPVVLANDRAQKGYQPIVSYVAGFITDQDYGPTEATSANGLSINGNSVKTIRVFVFNPNAVLNNPNSPDQAYDPSLGNPTVRLIG